MDWEHAIQICQLWLADDDAEDEGDDTKAFKMN